MSIATHSSWKTTTLAAAVALALASVALAQSDSARTAPRPLPQSQQSVERAPQSDFDDLAIEHAELSAFASAVKVAGLQNSLTNGKDFTVFAPTNEALHDKPGKDLDTLLQPENREELVSFLRAHIVADAIDLQSPREISEVRTIDGETIDIERADGVIKIDDAKVVNANGVSMGNLKIYAIDDVLSRSGKPIEDGQVFNRNSSAVAPNTTPGVAGAPPAR